MAHSFLLARILDKEKFIMQDNSTGSQFSRSRVLVGLRPPAEASSIKYFARLATVTVRVRGGGRIVF